MSTQKRKRRLKAKKIVRLKVPVEVLSRALAPQVEEELTKAERVDLVVVNDAGGKVAAIPVPKTAFRRLMDYLQQ